MPQLVVVAVGQEPLPVQLAALVWVPAVQLGATHCVLLDHFSQLPVPSHLPSLPQALGSVAVHPLLAVPPAGIGPHVPFASPVSVLLHAWQPPPQAWSQQKPSTQLLLTHSPLPPHEAPCPFSGAQTPLVVLVQYEPARHCPLLVQLVRHDPPEQV